jgi:hypothetical protein
VEAVRDETVNGEFGHVFKSGVIILEAHRGESFSVSAEMNDRA